MALTPGARFGPYEVNAQIGVGGMGEVYRATDTNLKRSVAIKVLPSAVATDAERLARFQREAEVLASLNHRNIAAIYGLEEADGTKALVMELVEGPTLADRIAQGPIPLDEALPVAKQVAEALEAAHEQGIIHRDLKPANIKVRADGTVKVLDFGLAKALDQAPGSGLQASGRDMASSPTITTPAMTQAGFILGTPAYMSPEQASGKLVDRRADIWSFGVVLWEVLAGQQLFHGETLSHTLADVLRAEIDFGRVPAATPAAISDLLRRCLDRDARSRLRDIGEARIVIERAITQPPPTSPSSAQRLSSAATLETRASPLRRVVPWAVSAVLGASLVAVLAIWAPPKDAPATRATERLNAEVGADVSLEKDLGASAVLSPDGQMLAIVARAQGSGEQQLYVRRLDQLQATLLTGTTDAASPFFSPDGQWIGFFAGGKLKKVSTAGGVVITLCDAPNGRGAWWSEDGTIVFTPENNFGVSLHRVSAAGGTPEPLTSLSEGDATQRWPQLLPGGKGVLYTATSTVGNDARTTAEATLVVQNLSTGERKTVQREGFYGRYLPSGHVVYIRDATLFAVPFDLARLEVTGQPVPVVVGIIANPSTAGAQFSVSDTGTLVYSPGGNTNAGKLISWMDKSGVLTALRSVPADWNSIRFSPDGRRLAMDISDGKQRDVWVYDWARDTMTRLTFDANDDASPVWTPDGSRIVFASKRADGITYNLYWQRADGTGDVQRLTESTHHQIPNSWLPSGKVLAFHEIFPPTESATDLMILPIEGSENLGWKPGKPAVFLNTPATEQNPMLSPDGRWLAYESNESGQLEIYVRRFPGPGGKWQVSNSGGAFATWSRTRKQLFYSTSDFHLLVAPYTVEGASFVAEKPQPWSPGQFTAGLYRRFDLHPDGERFAVSKDPDADSNTQDKVVFVFNFFDDLKRIAPTARR